LAGLPIHRCAIAPEWIDYNGHLRDAYYTLILSAAIDALMDRLGLDAGYRERTGCTLYTLEMHIHFLREVKREDEVIVAARLLACDPKRLHVALELERAADRALAATAEVLLLHVHQGPTVSTRPFPPEVAAAIAELKGASDALAAAGPGSRRIELSPPGTRAHP
jgi:acyl-CoA thioester hydrolase